MIDFTFNINGRNVTLPVNENDIIRAYEKIVCSDVAKGLRAYLHRSEPDAAKLYGDDYTRIVEGLAFELLDYLETEGLTVADIDDAMRFDIVRTLYHYSEVRNDHYDDNSGCICIDAWNTADDNEEGVVVARVYKDAVVFEVEKAKEALDVLRAIAEARIELDEM
jgi:hypothetical protein